MPIINIKGDLIKLMQAGEFDVVVHGCNCKNTWGAGVALAMKKAFPAAYKADMLTKQDDESKLGRFSRATVGDLTIVNAYTQFDYGNVDGHCYLNYLALRKVMERIHKAASGKNFKGKRIGMPTIGSGLAGGNPLIIKGIIENVFHDIDVYMVEYVVDSKPDIPKLPPITGVSKYIMEQENEHANTK